MMASEEEMLRLRKSKFIGAISLDIRDCIVHTYKIAAFLNFKNYSMAEVNL